MICLTIACVILDIDRSHPQHLVFHQIHQTESPIFIPSICQYYPQFLTGYPSVIKYGNAKSSSIDKFPIETSIPSGKLT